MNIGEKIRTFRKERGFTQKELAELISKGHTTISKYEKNERYPKPKTLLEISLVLNFAIEEFYK